MAPETFTVAGDPKAAHLYPAVITSEPRALFICAHGAGAGQSHPFMVRVARLLAERGISVVTFDFPYMQHGKKAPDRAPVLEDAFRRVIVASTALPAAERARLFIGGKSMGGRIATHLAAARDQWPASAPTLSGVIVFGYPLNPPGGPSRRSPDRTSHLAEIQAPTLIVQGTRDTFGGPDDIQSAMPAAAVHAVPTGDHSFNVLKSSGVSQAESDARVCDAVAAFARAARS